MKASPGLVLAALLMSASCSSDGHSDYAQYFKLLNESFNGTLKKGLVNREDAAAIPYASMGVRVNDGRQSIIILATQSEDSLLWTSNTHVVIETQQGRVRRTVGLPQDISATALQSQSMLIPPALALRQTFTSKRTVDFPDEKIYGLALNCRAVLRGNQNIVILQRKISTARVDETCTTSSPDWRFTDSYWIDWDSGFVWKTLQHLHPGGETLELEIFRPPS